MKKVMGFVLTAVLCLGMTTTVLASNSRVEDNTGNMPSSSTVIDGVEVELEVKTVEEARASLSAEQQTKIDEVLAVVNSGNATEVAEMQKTLIKDVAQKDVSQVKNSKLVDLTLPVGQTIPAGGISLTISDSNITAGMNIVMLHLKTDGTWENIPVTVGNGTIIGTFTSLSPVYYFEIVPVAQNIVYWPPIQNTPAATPAETTSPKTAEANMALYVSILAVVALGSAVYGTRKAKYSK